MDEIIPTIGTVAISHDGKILLVREGERSGHVTGMYGFASGRVERGETDKEAAVRELREETGLSAKISDLRTFDDNYFIADIRRKDGTIVRMGWKVFKVFNFWGHLKTDNETSPSWFELSDIEELEKAGKLLPNVLTAVRSALQ